MNKISEKVIKDVAKKIDDILPFNKLINGIIGTGIELVDGLFFRAALSALNDKFGEKIPAEYLPDIEKLLTAFVQDDYSDIDELLINRVNQAVDIPYLDESEEHTIIGGVIKTIISLIEQRKSKAA